MALFIKQSDDRSELQKRLAAELQDRARQKPAPGDLPDGVDDSSYIHGTKRTTSLAGVWLVVFLLAVGAIIWLIVATAE